MRKRGKKQLAILLSAALVMQGQAAYGANLEKTGETIQEAASEITAAEGEDAVPGDAEADDSKDENEKDEQENGDEESDLENDVDQDGEKDPDEEENRDGEDSAEGEKDQENGEDPGGNKDQSENSSDDEDGLEGEDQDKGESSKDSEDEEKDPEEDIEEDTSEGGSENEQEKEDIPAEEDSLKNEDKKEPVPEIPEVVEEEKDQKEKEVKILSWKWKDEQQALMEGELRLSVTEEDQIAFEEIGAMLPAEATASVSVEDDETEDVEEDAENTKDTAKTEKTKETDVPVLGWSCEDYVQDENGKWPTSGEFVFVAELPEEYVLAEGVSALEVKVVLEEPGVALMAEDWSDKISIDGTGYTIEKQSDFAYILNLTGFSGSNITISQGVWTININDTNTISNSKGPALVLSDGVNVTMKETGTLNLTGSTYGISVGRGALLSVNDGTINATGENLRDARTAGIIIDREATMTVGGGMIIADGRSASGVGNGIDIYEGGQFEMIGGSVTASAKDASLSLSGTAKIKYGTLKAPYILFDNSTSGNLQVTASGQVISSKITVCGSNAKLEINGADAEVTCNDELYIGEGTPTVTVNAGTLTANNINNKGKFTLQGGVLVLNGTYIKEDAGTFDYEGGSVTGKGSLPEGSKLPATITATSVNKNITIPGNIDVSRYFTVIPSELGDVTYSIDYDGIAEGERSEGTLSGIKNSILNVTKTGKLKIKANIEATNFYAASSGEVTLTVGKGQLNVDDVTIEPYNAEYDNAEHNAVTVTVKDTVGIQNMQVLYAPYTEGAEPPAESDYSTAIPQVKNVADTDKKYYVLIRSDNYEDYTALSGGVTITPMDINQCRMWMPDIVPVYNGMDLTPTIAIFSGDNKVLSTVSDYNVVCNPPKPFVNAGTYHITLTGIGNYTGSIEKTYRIDKYNLSGASITVQLDAVYNGNPQTLREDQIKVMAGDIEVPFDDYKLSYKNNINAGDQAEVTITAKDDSVNFTGSQTVKFTIEKAPLKIAGAVLEPKTYDTTADATVQSVQFSGLCGSDQLTAADYTASAKFTDVNAGNDKEAVLNVSLNHTSTANNYELSDGVYHLSNQTIQKAPAPTLPDTDVSYTFGATGDRIVDISPLFPDDCGEMTAMTAAVTSDDIQALDPQVSADLQAKTVSFRLLGNKKENIGKTAEITVSGIETTNYQDMTAKVIVTLGAKKEQDAPQIHMSCYPNSDGETFTTEITTVTDAEYSFDGINWSDNNVKSDCLGGDTYTGYIRMKENEEEYASPFAKMDLTMPKQAVKTPVITPESGRFHGLQQIEISCATVDAKIYYTVDGTEPTAESTLYTGPFTISQSATVKAVAVKEHMADSAVAEAVFEYDASKDSDGSSWENSSSKSAQSGQKSTLADTPTQDSQKGWISTVLGIITGEGNGYSHWEKTENKAENNSQSTSQTWKLCYADGNYAAGTMETAADGTLYEQPHWEMINGTWYAFGADQYAKDGWIYDPQYKTWFYIDIDRGMYTGWVFINGTWYYFHPISDGRKGAMYKAQQTPDGYYVDENGAWDGKEK